MQGKKIQRALGLIPKAPYSAESVLLDDIDRLLIFTDGLHEVENADGTQLGIDRIMQKMEQTIDDDLEWSLDQVLDEAKDYAAGQQFEDDVCLFAMDVGSG